MRWQIKILFIFNSFSRTENVCEMSYATMREFVSSVTFDLISTMCHLLTIQKSQSHSSRTRSMDSSMLSSILIQTPRDWLLVRCGAPRSSWSRRHSDRALRSDLQTSDTSTMSLASGTRDYQAAAESRLVPSDPQILSSPTACWWYYPSR